MLPVIPWAAGLVSLGLVLSVVWTRWSFRRRVWLSEPQRLLAVHSPPAVVLNLALLLSVVAAIAGLRSANAWHVPLAVWIAAFGAFGAAHLQWQAWRGVVGLCVLMAMFVCLGEAWTWGVGSYGPVIGAVLGLLLLRWLARFWEQQLDEGQAWTTAGRLIPLCRSVSLAMLGFVIGLVLRVL